MPDLGGMMSGAIWAMARSFVLYMALPALAVGFILKLLRVNRKTVGLFMGAVALIGFYRLFTDGFPALTERIQQGIEQGSSK